MIINNEERTIYFDASKASKSDIKQIKELQSEGYKAINEASSDRSTKAMPHNMGIHADSRLF